MEPCRVKVQAVTEKQFLEAEHAMMMDSNARAKQDLEDKHVAEVERHRVQTVGTEAQGKDHLLAVAQLNEEMTSVRDERAVTEKQELEDKVLGSAFSTPEKHVAASALSTASSPFMKKVDRTSDIFIAKDVAKVLTKPSTWMQVQPKMRLRATMTSDQNSASKESHA